MVDKSLKLEARRLIKEQNCSLVFCRAFEAEDGFQNPNSLELIIARVKKIEKLATVVLGDFILLGFVYL